MAQFTYRWTSSQLILLICFFTLQYSVNCASLRRKSGLRHTRRSAKDHQLLDLSEKFSSASFQEIVASCNHNKTCKNALLKLKTKCAVKLKSCNAKMTDLPVCAEIMETVMRTFYNPERKSDCEEGDHRCLQLYNAIYKNPCFASVRYLQKMKMLPKLEDMQTLSRKDSPRREASTKSNDVMNKRPISTVATSTIRVVKTTRTPMLTIDNRKSGNAASPVDHVLVFKHVTNDVTHVKESVINTSADDANFSVLNPTQKSNNNESLLRVVAITTGAIVFVILILAAILWFYFGLGKKAKHVEEATRI